MYNNNYHPNRDQIHADLALTLPPEERAGSVYKQFFKVVLEEFLQIAILKENQQKMIIHYLYTEALLPHLTNEDEEDEYDYNADPEHWRTNEEFNTFITHQWNQLTGAQIHRIVEPKITQLFTDLKKMREEKKKNKNPKR
jgi:hypothetical protein